MSVRFLRRTTMTALVAGLLLSACGEDVSGAADDGVDLTGSWHLVSGRDADGSFDLTGRSVTLVVEGDAASGTSACNHYSGALEVEGDSVRLSGIGGTEMACEPAVMDLERRYLDDPPTAEEIRAVLERLALEPWHLARTGEPVAKELGLAALPRDAAHRDRWVEAMVEHPILIQRPILTADDGTTVVGRDPDSLEEVVRAGTPLRP